MMDREYVGIRQATQKGYIECEIGGVADFSYPTNLIRNHYYICASFGAVNNINVGI